MAITYNSDLSITALTLPVDVFVRNDYLAVGTAQYTSTASMTIRNSSNSAYTLRSIGLANSTNEIHCVQLGGTSNYPITIPANSSVTLTNNVGSSLQFCEQIVNFSTALQNYFSQNASVYNLQLDCFYFVNSNYGSEYIALPSSFTTALYAVRDRLRVTANTFSKSIYKIGDTISGTITLLNQGCFDVGKTSLQNGYGRFILGNDDLLNGIFEDYNGSKVIPAKSSVTLSFSATAAYTEEMDDYLADHPSERAVTINNLTNKYNYYVYDSSGNQAAFGNNEILTIPLVATASIGGAIYNPIIDSFVVERSIAGVLSDEGTDILSTFKVSTSDGTYPATFALTITDNNNVSYDATSYIAAAMTGVTRNDTIISNQYSNGSDFTFTLTFGDQYESASMAYSISNAFANFHLSGQPTGGACFGGFSASTLNNPILESYYPIRAYSGIDVAGNMDVTGDISVSGETSLQDKVYVTGGRENMLDENGNSFVGAKYIQGGHFASFSIPTGTNKSPADGAIPITESGFYLATMFVNWGGSNGTNERLIYVSKNTTGWGANTFAYERLFGQRNGELVCNCAGVEYCQAGDTIFFGLHQNSGSTLSVWGHYYLVKL